MINDSTPKVWVLGKWYTLPIAMGKNMADCLMEPPARIPGLKLECKHIWDEHTFNGQPATTCAKCNVMKTVIYDLAGGHGRAAYFGPNGNSLGGYSW